MSGRYRGGRGGADAGDPRASRDSGGYPPQAYGQGEQWPGEQGHGYEEQGYSRPDYGQAGDPRQGNQRQGNPRDGRGEHGYPGDDRSRRDGGAARPGG